MRSRNYEPIPIIIYGGITVKTIQDEGTFTVGKAIVKQSSSQSTVNTVTGQITGDDNEIIQKPIASPLYDMDYTKKIDTEVYSAKRFD